ncbi:putative eukaryotic translation initiation factor 3 subunit EifCf [Kalaharituber pfeilii]|nr:putative eukaryotic translation initiation factor 3 subunit EifCf [Kalaharituber pfeilii]
MADKDSFIHLARPLPVAPVSSAYQGSVSTAPLNVIIHPQALFSMLDHSLRRNEGQERVIGTLLGVRSEDGSEVEIRNSFAVGHNESQEQVEVDMDYHKTMLNLHLKANPREVLVGWYATSPFLNTFSALIQNFYASAETGTFPHPAVHLTLSTVPGQDISVRTYISAPVGITPDRAADSCLFLPVPHEMRYADAEKSGLETIASAKNDPSRTAKVMTDVHALERAIGDVLDMLDRVSIYVSGIISSLTEAEDDPSTTSPAVENAKSPATTAIGKFLLNTLSLAPKVSAEEVERMFNVHVQDVLLVSYLANTIRTQIDLGNRLAGIALGRAYTGLNRVLGWG